MSFIVSIGSQALSAALYPLLIGDGKLVFGDGEGDPFTARPKVPAALQI